MRNLAFAFGAGALAPVSPCGFALLPAFLTTMLRPAGTGSGLAERFLGGVAVGGRVAAGYGAVHLVGGLAVAGGLRWLVRSTPWVALAIGVVLAATGVAVLVRGHLPLRIPAPGAERGPGRPKGAIAFGAAHAVASLSCTLAIFLAVVGQALATAGLAGTAAVLVAYTAGSATLLVALAVSAALARDRLARPLRRLLPVADRLAGVILAASGVSLVAYWLPVLTTGSVPAAGLPGAAGASATAFLDGRRSLVVALAVILAVATAVAARSRGKRRRWFAAGEPALPPGMGGPPTGRRRPWRSA